MIQPDEIQNTNTGISPVIISEICDTSPADAGFIELYNRSASNIDLSFFRMHFYLDGQTESVSSKSLSGILPPGEFYIIRRGSSSDLTFYNNYGYHADNNWDRSFIEPGQALDLSNNGRADQFYFIPGDLATGLPPKDRCFERATAAGDGSLSVHWNVSSGQIPGTPGRHNSTGCVQPESEFIFCRFKNYSDQTVLPGETGIMLAGFRIYSAAAGAMLKALRISNNNTMTAEDIYRLSLYSDQNTNNIFDNEDLFICDLSWNSAQCKFFNETVCFNLDPAFSLHDFVLILSLEPDCRGGKIFSPVIHTADIELINSYTAQTYKKPDNKYTFTHSVTAANQLRTVVINEIAWMGTIAGSSHEWIELYNNTENTVNLENWRLAESGGSADIISLSGSIPSRGFYLIERLNDNTISNVSADLYGSWGGSGLGNSGENIVLINSSGNIIDQVNCISGWFGGTATGEYRSMERTDPLLPGYWPVSWSTCSGSACTFAWASDGGNLYGTPKAVNSVFNPQDYLLAEHYNIPEKNIYRGSSNITIFAFSAFSTFTSGYFLNKFENTGTLTAQEATNLSLYLDIDTNRTLTSPDIFIENLSCNDSSWKAGSELMNCSNYIITANLGYYGMTFGHTFKGRLSSLISLSGKYAYGGENTFSQILISKPPLITNVILNTGTVSNCNLQNFDIQAWYSNREDGFGKMQACFPEYRDYGPVYTMYSADSDFCCVYTNARVWGNIMPGLRKFEITVWDEKLFTNTGFSTNIIITGFTPPQILSVSSSPSDIYNSGAFRAEFSLLARDTNNTGLITGGSAYLSNIGYPVQGLSHTEYTNWYISAVIPAEVPPGSNNVTLLVQNNFGAWSASNISFLLKTHKNPDAFAGEGLFARGGDIIYLGGRGTAYDGACINNYIWDIFSGADFSLVCSKGQNIAFTAPYINGILEMRLRVTDNYGATSTGNIMQIFVSSSESYKNSLKDAGPYNTVINPQTSKLKLVNLMPNTAVGIYTASGEPVTGFTSEGQTAEYIIPSSFESGVYIIHLSSGKETKKFKVIIIR